MSGELPSSDLMQAARAAELLVNQFQSLIKIRPVLVELANSDRLVQEHHALIADLGNQATRARADAEDAAAKLEAAQALIADHDEAIRQKHADADAAIAAKHADADAIVETAKSTAAQIAAQAQQDAEAELAKHAALMDGKRRELADMQAEVNSTRASALAEAKRLSGIKEEIARLRAKL